MSREVATGLALDLDRPGAEIGQDARAERARDRMLEADYQQTLQGTAALCHRAFRACAFTALHTLECTIMLDHASPSEYYLVTMAIAIDA